MNDRLLFNFDFTHQRFVNSNFHLHAPHVGQNKDRLVPPDRSTLVRFFIVPAVAAIGESSSLRRFHFVFGQIFFMLFQASFLNLQPSFFIAQFVLGLGKFSGCGRLGSLQ